MWEPLCYIARNLRAVSSILTLWNLELRTCVQIDSDIGPVLLISVYMPTNYNDDPSLHAYIDMCSKLNEILIETDPFTQLLQVISTVKKGRDFLLNSQSLHPKII